MKFAANLTMLYPELPFLERFAAAAADGYTGVEFVSPYEYPPHQIADLLAEHNLTMVLFNLPAGDWAGGERGIAALPDRVTEFRDGVQTAIEYALALGATQVNCLAGILPEGITQEQARETLVDNVAFAAAQLARHDISLLVEPVNNRDIPGFFLSRVDQAVGIIEEVSLASLSLQYDLYHAQVMQGDLLPTFLRHQPLIRHIQLADHPGRHEPGTGEINYPFLLRAIRDAGYDGWFGCEYIPREGVGMAWLQDYQDEEQV